VTATLTKVTIAEALDIMGWTAHGLAVRANVHTATVMRAMIPGGKFKTNDTSAAAIAGALGLRVEEIIWANGTSILGRPAESGVSLSATTSRSCAEEMCHVHNLVLPASKVCDMCG